jgi:hypothetical protein
MWPGLVEYPLVPYSVSSSQSAGSVDPIKILLASHRATPLDFMALSDDSTSALA